MTSEDAIKIIAKAIRDDSTGGERTMAHTALKALEAELLEEKRMNKMLAEAVIDLLYQPISGITLGSKLEVKITEQEALDLINNVMIGLRAIIDADHAEAIALAQRIGGK